MRTTLSIRPWHVGAIAFLFTWTLTTHGKFSVSGDEPHYLIVDQSLLADRDLDLTNNYANDDGRLFGHAGLAMELHARPARVGGTQSVHDIGLPLLLLPMYAASQVIAEVPPERWLTRARMNRGLFAYSLLSLCLIGLTAWGMTLLTAALVTITLDTRVAWLGLALAISPPIVSHAFLIFPETIALFVTSLVVWISSRSENIGRDRRLFAITMFCLGLLPWLHRKYSLYVFGLAFLLIWSRRQLIRSLPTKTQSVAAALFIVPHAAFYFWSVYVWGSIGGPQTIDVAPLNFETFIAGFPGLWVDRQSGVLAFAPLYLPLALAWAFSWKRSWIYFVPFIALYVPMAAYREWWGGFSPAARYLVPVMPLVAVPLAFALRIKWMRIALLALALPQMAVNAILWQHPRWMWPQASTRNLALDALGAPGRLYESWLPTLQPPATVRFAPFLVICAAILGSAILGVIVQRAAWLAVASGEEADEPAPAANASPGSS